AARRARLDAHSLIGGGILLAGLAGMGSWLAGSAFLTSAHGHFSLPLLGQVEWSSVLLFDLGVFATVVGTVLLALATLARVKGPVIETVAQEQVGKVARAEPQRVRRRGSA
ncbi:MAG TPA: MnhB domain-containing protein, partial [Planctomycetota bacterium]|nr:MnhB domain-containing protein [Planctomycetota bacterium]